MKTTLPDSALPAWEAYQAMQRTKQTHFDLLALLEAKRERRQRPTLAEELRLKQLLKAHDEQVAAFRAELKTLRERDLAEFETLIKHFKLLNTELAGGSA